MPSFINPEFFDIFGFLIFAFITALSIWAIKTKSSVPKWALSILLIMGMAGFMVDGFIVYTTYFR